MKKTLLLVHDNEEILTKLSGELSDLTQMLIIKARDGVEASQKSRNQKFDFIITKWNLPKVTGTNLIDAIKKDSSNELTPILIIDEDNQIIEMSSNLTEKFKHIEIVSGNFDVNSLTQKIKEVSKTLTKTKSFKLDVNFINPIIEVSTNTLIELCHIDQIKNLRPYLTTNEEELEIDISGTLDITSPYFKGLIAVSFSNDVYKKVIGKMLEEDVEEINIDNQDGAAEIINIIFGNSKAVLNNLGYKIKKAIPNVIRGEKHKIVKSKTPILLVPFDSDVGRFYIQICVKAI